MATAKPHHTSGPGPRRHPWRNGLIVVVLLAALGISLIWHRLQTQSILAASYGARIACTCHYIAGRDLNDCRKDFEPGMALVMLSDNATARSVTARVPLIASQTATLRDGAGCQLQGWGP